jgi:hypothetical protein
MLPEAHFGNFMVKVKVPANETVSRLVQMGCGRVATDHGSIACSIQEKVESLGAMQKELARSRQLPIAQGGDELVAHVFSFLRVQTEEGGVGGERGKRATGTGTRSVYLDHWKRGLTVGAAGLDDGDVIGLWHRRSCLW